MATKPEIVQAQINGELFQKVCAEINAKVPLEFGKFLRGEGASIAKTALGYTKMAKRAPLDLRAYRRAFSGNDNSWRGGFGVEERITVTSGVRGSQLGRGGIWYRFGHFFVGKDKVPLFVKLGKIEYGKIPPSNPWSGLETIDKDTLKAYRHCLAKQKAYYIHERDKYRPLQGLSKSSWYQIIRDLGFSESQALQLSPKWSIPKQVRNRFIACGRQIKMGYAREYKYTGSGRWYVEIENRSTAVIKGGGASILHRAIATRKTAFLNNFKYNIYNSLDKIIERHPYIQWG